MSVELSLRVQAPAKLNLCLYVAPGRRADGLHEIRSLFQSISLADELLIAAAATGDDLVECPGVEDPNLVAAALAAFRLSADWHELPLKVTIDKRIPIAAGLGGGSADAAALLRTLNRLAPRPLAAAQLAELAMSIGSDVSSQLNPGTHLVAGAGELVEPLPRLAEFAVVILPSDKQLATAAVYAEADRLAASSDRSAELGADLGAAVRDVESAEQLAELVHNDLRAPALALEPRIESALEALEALDPLAVEVAGSGPTVFALFPSRAAAAAALAAQPIPGALIAEPVGGSDD